MNEELVVKTKNFLKEKFEHAEYFAEHPEKATYRLEHSYRVANIGKIIAEAENLDATKTVIACLLHDIAYCEDMSTEELWLEHGRNSAKIARPFLEELGLSEDDINDICYAIAIHVDDKADFEWDRTAFSETIGDADNIDRYDAYRIYESLEYKKYSEMPINEKRELVTGFLERLEKFREINFATKTAAELWKTRIDFYIAFYERLKDQIEASEDII